MNHPTIRYIDHTTITQFHDEPFTAMTSFGIDDALAIAVSKETSPPTIRLWVHPKTIVLGIPDGRLPYVQEGIHILKENGYQAIIRNSGGLAVALDEGVLNLSLIIPSAKNISITDGYETMYELIQYILKDLTTDIKAYEIVGSYCPGDYDLSIGGVKFAGISQRRIHDGVAVQIYIDVEGNSQDRASLIRNFYDISLKGEETKFHYPIVNPEKMGSLSELLGKQLTIDDMKERVQNAIGELCDKVITLPFSDEEIENYHTRFQQMKKRNERII